MQVSIGKITKSICFISFLMCLCFPSSSANAKELKIGMSTALTGPLKAIGQDMCLGVETYFAKINQQGGINGHMLKLIVKDDGYEPRNAAHNMHELIEQEDVLAFIGNVGTPTAIVSLPIAIHSKVLFFGALTGADLLRKKEYQPYAVNFRASYAEETAVMIDGLLSMGIKPEEIAFFTQHDGYGDDGYKGAIKALFKMGFDSGKQLVHGRYTRNALNVHDAVAQLLDAEVEPKAVIMVSGYEPAAEFIQVAKQDLPDLLFLNVSFVGSQALKDALGEETENVIITQVVPPYDSDLPTAQEYYADLQRFSAESKPGFVSFEGYISAKIFVEGLSNIEGDVTRQSLVDAFQKIKNLDIGIDTLLSIRKGKNRSHKRVWPTEINEGRFEPFYWNKPQTLNTSDKTGGQED